jgi:hypothetical protein
MLAVVIAAAFFVWQDYNYALKHSPGSTAVLPTSAAPMAFADTAVNFPVPDFTRYEMTVVFDPASRMLYGNSMIYTRNTTGAPLSLLPLQCYPNAFRSATASPAPAAAYTGGFNPGWMEIGAVSVDGVPAAINSGTDVTVWLTAPASLPAGADFSISLDWQILLPQVAYRFGAQDGVFSLGHFYPRLVWADGSGWHTGYNSKVGDPFCLASADYSITFSVPAGYEIITNATAAEYDGSGQRRYQAAQVRDLSLCIINRYLQTAMQSSGVMLRTYYPLGSRQPDIRHMASIMDYYIKRFGPYALPEFKAVYLPMLGFDGMEYSGLILLKQEYATEDLPNESFVLAHEIAHQWWYGMVGNDQITHPWMDEGLANWAAYHYLHDIEGAALPASGRATLLDRELKSFSGRNDYYATAYTQGANFWLELERRIGADNVFAALRLYRERYSGKIAAPTDLLQCIQELSDQSLSAFFSAWI